MGKEVSVFPHTARNRSPVNAQYVAQTREWSITVWETNSREFAI
jgi:hypothetical protein